MLFVFVSLAAPVTRLTPLFHDIHIENVTATGSSVAAQIVGLPEAPVKDITLKNVNLSAEKGASFAYAEVKATNVTVKAAQGENYTFGPGAAVEGIPHKE